jgi:hypothetical protein
MASLLLSGDSLPRHLEITRRHMRKCSKTNGAAPFGERIKPLYDKLKAIYGKLETAQEEIQDGYDDIELADTLLDDTVRDLFDLITISDRRNTGMPLLPKVFPEGKFGYVVDSPLATEIDEVKKIIDRLNEADTENKFDRVCNKANREHDRRRAVHRTHSKTKMDSYKSVKSEAEIIKSDLRWQYEVNYLDARKQMGRKRAELLFPKKNNSTKNIVEESEEI